MSEEELREFTAVADKLTDSELSEELERLALREKELITNLDVKTPDYENIREISIFNMTVLAASSARLKR